MMPQVGPGNRDMELSVVIPTMNKVGPLARTLSALLAQDPLSCPERVGRGQPSAFGLIQTGLRQEQTHAITVFLGEQPGRGKCFAKRGRDRDHDQHHAANKNGRA